MTEERGSRVAYLCNIASSDIQVLQISQGVIQDFEFGGVLKYEWGSGSAEPGAQSAPAHGAAMLGVGAGGGPGVITPGKI
jgi:hypothetical protein